MEQIDLEQYGNLPRQVRQQLATANSKEAQPSQYEKSEVDKPFEQESQSQNDVIEQTETSVSGESETLAQSELPTAPEDNESKSWKGRLSKEQQAHKETQNRYLAEAEARQKAEQEAKEAREKLAAFEAKLNPQTQQSAQSTQPSQPMGEQASQDENPFTDEELSEIEFSMGPIGKKLAGFLRSQKGKPQQSASQIDVEKVIDERFTQERQRNEQQAKTEAFGKALQQQVPTLQGLLNDSAFVEFMNNEVIDFAGNTASALLNFIGQNKRADMIPQVAKLVEKFEQSRQPTQQTVTAAPSNKGAAVNVRSNGKKPKPSPAIIEKMQRLARLGDVEKLRELQDKYDLD